MTMDKQKAYEVLAKAVILYAPMGKELIEALEELCTESEGKKCFLR